MSSSRDPESPDTRNPLSQSDFRQRDDDRTSHVPDPSQGDRKSYRYGPPPSQGSYPPPAAPGAAVPSARNPYAPRGASAIPGKSPLAPAATDPLARTNPDGAVNSMRAAQGEQRSPYAPPPPPQGYTPGPPPPSRPHAQPIAPTPPIGSPPAAAAPPAQFQTVIEPKVMPTPDPDMARTNIYQPGGDLGKTQAVLPGELIEDPTLSRTVGPEGFDGTRIMAPGDDSPAPQSGAGLVGSPASTQPIYGKELPDDAPEWMRVGRLLALQIEDAIATARSDHESRASIGRAWAAFNMGGYTPSQIRQVAQLVSQAHKMMRDSIRSDLDAVIEDCTVIVRNGLPGDLRRYMAFERVQATVQQLAAEEDPAIARVQAVSSLLGWTGAAFAWAAEAVALAMGEIE